MKEHRWVAHTIREVQLLKRADGEFVALDIPDANQGTVFGCDDCSQSVYDAWGTPCLAEVARVDGSEEDHES